MSREKIGQNRYNNLSSEMANALVPLIVSERSVLGFIRTLCTRFDVDLTGAGTGYGPVCAWIPDKTMPNGINRVRWDVIVSLLDYKLLRLVIQENPPLFAMFACSFAPKPHENPEGVQIEENMFDSFPEPKRAGGAVWKLPKNLIAPKSFRTVWTCTGPLAHGADEKHGNVTMFRRHKVIDRLTGEHSYVPFISGNAVRGMWRDLLMARYLELAGVNPHDLPKSRVHALFSGGTIESGADTSKIDVMARKRARALCPPWDLLAGCIDGQIMAGHARVHDAVLVCRENAWYVHNTVAPNTDVHEFAASLEDSSELTTLRLLTRMAHREYEGSEGAQMLTNTEHIINGAQFVHTFQLFGVDGVSPLTQSCLSDLLNSFEGYAQVGAGNSRGYGLIAFDPYVPDPSVPALTPSSEYLQFMAENKDAVRDWLFNSTPTTVDEGGGEEKTKGKAKGKPKGKASAVEDTNVTLVG
jgi:hypothetical protein